MTSDLLLHAHEGRYGLFINGGYCNATGDERVDSINPVDGKPWYDIANANQSDVNKAVDAARSALRHPAWRGITQTARGKLLRRLADLIADHGPRLAEIECRDNGKLLKEMTAQMAHLPETYYYFAGMSDKITGDTIPVNKSSVFNFTRYEPVGVVAVVIPWNSPLYLLAGALAPCLAIGNTVVAKPAENTSASALEFAAIMSEAGFPDGVFNVITGTGETTGDLLTSHPGINRIAFTGGTETGRKIAGNAANNLVPCTMELGGKSPHVVYADADPERAVNGIVAGVFAAGGQTCIAGSRCFVEHSVFDDVVERLGQRAAAVKIGDPLLEDTELGPLALQSQLEKVEYYVNSGIREGGTIQAGGKRPGELADRGGYFFEPTVFTDVSNDMQVARDEIFGPVVAVMPFKTEEELLHKANDTVYGLAAGIWTRDIDRALRFAHEVDAGTVWINTYRSASFMSPFGGFKQSGYGKHNGFEAMREYSRLKNVVVDYSGATQDPFILKLK